MGEMFLQNLIVYFIFSSALAQVSKWNSNGLVGGRNPKPGEAKYIVAIRSNKRVCGGGIIGEKFIITAAHCVKVDSETGKLLDPIRVIAGTEVATGYNRGTVVKRSVVRAYFPTHYVHRGHDDIAVLELDQPLRLIKYHRKIKKLYLPEPLNDDPSRYPTYENELVMFAGYGYSQAKLVDNDGQIEVQRSGLGRLQIAKSVIDDIQTCKEYFPNTRDDQMCLSVIEDETKTNLQGTCSGDSGSPAVYNNRVIIGLDSIGIYCNNNKAPSRFTRVSSYIPFIMKAMNNDTEGLVVYEA